MANRGYQYETSPRKLEPEYQPVKRKVKKKKIKNSTKKANTKSNKNSTKNRFKTRFLITSNLFIIFAILFVIIYRNSLISQSFSQIQTLKSQVTELQKENDQLEIGIQNSLNINNIEQAAKDLLGMQKLSSKQTVYLTLPKKDYVEPSTEEVIIEENLSMFDKVSNYINDLF